MEYTRNRLACPTDYLSIWPIIRYQSGTTNTSYRDELSDSWMMMNSWSGRWFEMHRTKRWGMAIHGMIFVFLANLRGLPVSYMGTHGMQNCSWCQWFRDRIVLEERNDSLGITTRRRRREPCLAQSIPSIQRAVHIHRPAPPPFRAVRQSHGNDEHRILHIF